MPRLDARRRRTLWWLVLMPAPAFQLDFTRMLRRSLRAVLLTALALQATLGGQAWAWWSAALHGSKHAPVVVAPKPCCCAGRKTACKCGCACAIGGLRLVDFKSPPKPAIQAHNGPVVDCPCDDTPLAPGAGLPSLSVVNVLWLDTAGRNAWPPVEFSAPANPADPPDAPPPRA